MKRCDRSDERGGLGWDETTESEMLNSFDMSRSDADKVSSQGYTVYIEGTDIMVNDRNSYPSVP